MNVSLSQVRVVFSVLAAAAALSVQAAVFDDARIWFNGASDRNGDGIFQKGEWRDVLHMADDSHAHHDTAYSANEPSDRMTIVRENVICPYRNATLSDMPCLGFPQPVTTNELVTIEGVTYPVVSVKPNHLVLPDFLSDYGHSRTCSTYTAVLRFRYDEPVDHHPNYQTAVAHFGFKWVSGGGSGIAACLVRPGGAPDDNARWLQFYCGSAAAYDLKYNSKEKGGGEMVPKIYPGSWVDLAVRVRGQTVTFAYTWNDVGDGTIVATNHQIRFWTSTVDSKYNPGIILPANETKHTFRLGGETAVASSVVFTNGYSWSGSNARKSFRGLVQQYAFWDRDLADDEILEAFGRPRPGLASLGIADGTADEFAATTSVVHVDGQWQYFNPTLAAKDAQCQVKFTAEKTMAGLPQNLRVSFAARPSARPLPTVTVNGTAITRVDADAGTRVDWYVPKNVIVAGTNTIAFVRTDEASDPLTIDALELGGSWQIGDPTVWAGDIFEHESNSTNVFHLTDGNLRHFKRGVSGGGVNRFDEIVFPLPEGLGGQCRATYTIRTEEWAGVSDYRLTLSVNGTPVETKEVAGGVFTSWNIPAAALQAGDNVLRLYKEDSGGWVNIRSHRFELGHLPHGLVILFR